MNCKKCGSQLEPNAKFCITCGEKVEELNNQAVAAQSPQPILPDAPEAPLPGTANKVTDAPVAQPTAEVQLSAPVAPQTPVAPVNAAPQAPVNATPQAPAAQPTANKNSNMLLIIIIVVLAICAGILLFVLLYGTNGLKNKDKTTTTTTEATTTKKVTTTERITTTKKVSEEVVNGVSVTIPDGWTYSQYNTLGKITNASRGTDIYFLPFKDNKFINYKQNPTAFEQVLVEKGFTVSAKSSGSEGSQEYLLYSVVTKSGTPEIVLLTSMPNGDLIRFEVLKMDISADEVLAATNAIASSAIVSGQSFSANIGEYLG